MSLLLRVRPIHTEEELRALVEAAREDDHGVLSPTHLIAQGDQIVGYLGSLPLATFWLDSKKVLPREAMAAISTSEAIRATQGVGLTATICAESSPFFPYMERLGYAPLTTRLFLKRL